MGTYCHTPLAREERRTFWQPKRQPLGIIAGLRLHSLAFLEVISIPKALRMWPCPQHVVGTIWAASTDEAPGS